MSRMQVQNVIVIGAGSAGLMAARELARAGRTVTILEARDRCGGRISPLSADEFGYRAEGGAEFVHGEAPVTRGLLREAGLSALPVHGARWTLENGAFSSNEAPDPHAGRLHQLAADLTSDMPVALFLKRYFADPAYGRLRRSVTRMVEGYDAADPEQASVLALREEWMNDEQSSQARILGGYGGLIDFLAAECRKQGVRIHLDAAVSAIETSDGGAAVICANGARYSADVAILTVPLPLLRQIALPPALRGKMAAAAKIGFGNVIKLLLRFKSRWWTQVEGRELSDLLFLLTDADVPVWWTQRPSDQPVLTGWLAGPRTSGLAHLGERELIEAGLASLAGIFGLSATQLRHDIVAARAINWGNDPFARGAYSYATPETRAAQSELARWDGDPVLFSGEALYHGPDMGTVEAALTSGQATARTILGAEA